MGLFENNQQIKRKLSVTFKDQGSSKLQKSRTVSKTLFTKDVKWPSISLTSILYDFIKDLKPDPINEIRDLTYQKKEVGEELVEWKKRTYLIKLTLSKLKHIMYLRYIVVFFNPQTYFQENHNKENVSVEGRTLRSTSLVELS